MTMAAGLEALERALSLFTTTMHEASAGVGDAGRWERATGHLQQELARLRSFADVEHQNSSAIKSVASRLTQLARTLDGLSLPAVRAGQQLVAQQRSVVFAAWRLAQVLEQHSAMQAGR